MSTNPRIQVEFPNPRIQVEFPSGNVKEIYLLQLLVEAQNAEFKVKHGMFLPGCGKQHPTVAKLREKYELPPDVKRWDQVSPILRSMYDELSAAYTEAVKAMQNA
jgi:hypothetical protein